MRSTVRFIACASLALGMLLAGAAVAQTIEQGKIRIEWLGHQFYRLTSPSGVVILTSPWLGNPDGPVPLDSVRRADFILSNNANTGDLGNPLEIAAVSGATVLAPGPLGAWLIEQGLKKEQFQRAGIGDRITLKGITFKIGPSAHDNTLATGADGGPAISFFIIFENGFTVFYNGHSTLLGDLALYAATYQPNMAILGLAGDPPEFAAVAKLMATNNLRLKTIIPSQARPNAPIVAAGRTALVRVGLADLMFVPKLRTPYPY